ncbi:hypothetical protein IPA_03265 [Ignicoccus pacificus DSM 13166]|uniref:UPF0201 protein IPA_03265 n=1 Tax=Ignicoccus pacificus DSM 13166 TaxID=940294 RepID=A0A977KB15_9CREN|nr:hypothetical protein IPA_03265 [Ignicoccus pacificus DSM 13166]
MRIRIESEVRPTEDPQKVLKALRKLFSTNFELVERGEGWASWVGECEDPSCLEPLRSAIHSKSLDFTFRSELRKLARGGGGRLVFRLNKQAAFVGVPSFAEEDVDSPMGPIIVEIEADSQEELYELINWLTGE